MRRINLVGKRFGKWAVLRFVGGKPQPRWDCICDCGVQRAVTGANLRSGKSTSCGICTRAEHAKRNAKFRDTAGDKNPRARKARAALGDKYVPSNSVWYKRAAGV